MTVVKGRITRAIKKIETACRAFVDEDEETAPTLMMDRLAEEASDNREKVKKEINNMYEIAAMLTDAIACSKPTEVGEDPETTVNKIEDDFKTYSKKFESFRNQFKETLPRVDTRLSPQNKREEIQTVQNNGFGKFATIPDLKPTFLEKEATMIKVNQWAKQFMNYINMGYSNGLPQRRISMHLRPLMHVSWLQSLDDKDPENKNLEQLI